jgi:hypothetical protein
MTEKLIKIEKASVEFEKAPDRSGQTTESNDDGDNGPKNKPSQSEILLRIANTEKYFHTPDGREYARIRVRDHHEVYLIESPAFKRWLSKIFYRSEGKVLGSETLKGAITVLCGQAQFDGPEHQVHVRLAEHGGNIYLDLADKKWRVVEISKSGWKIITDSPVYFRRPKAMAPLPIPSTDGDITEIEKVLNISHPGTYELIVAWLIGAFHPNGPYPLLGINGEQGSAKTTMSRFLKSLVDPSLIDVRSKPKSEHDLVISAANLWCLAIDNLSGIGSELSDALCRLSTGGGFSVRRLYSNDEESLFTSKRPVIINGIADLITRHDLADRTIFITLDHIPDHKRMTERKMAAICDEIRPVVLGGILDALVTGLQNIGEVELPSHPRMADFAEWVVACEPRLPMGPGQFMKHYSSNRTELVKATLDANLFGSTLRDWMEKRIGPWEGTATELLEALNSFTEGEYERNKFWPKDATRLSARLRRLATSLRKLGIEVDFSRSASRTISISKKLPTPASIASIPTSYDADDAVDATLEVFPDAYEQQMIE